MSKEEWDELPWWETVALVEGLEWEKILKAPEGQESNVDIVSGNVPSGFGGR